MATTKLAFGSILGTVTSAADAVGSIFNTTTKSIGMLDSFVTKAADEQTMSHKKDKLTFTKNLLRLHGEEEAKANLKVRDFCKQSPVHEELFKTAYDELLSIIAPPTDEAATAAE